MDNGNFPLNIPVDGAGNNQQNNPNLPVWRQITTAFIYGIVPAVSMAFVGYTFNRYRVKSEALDIAGSEETSKSLNKVIEELKDVDKKQGTYLADKVILLVNRLSTELSDDVAVCSSMSHGYQKNFGDLNRLSSLLKQVENDQDGLLKDRQLDLEKRYDVILDILDIACSRFTPKWKRIDLQNNLIDNVINRQSILFQLKMKEGLRDIFDHDSRFAGCCKNDNGKLWRVYAQLWAERAEKIKYKKIVEALKKNLPGL